MCYKSFLVSEEVRFSHTKRKVEQDSTTNSSGAITFLSFKKAARIVLRLAPLKKPLPAVGGLQGPGHGHACVWCCTVICGPQEALAVPM